MVSSMQLFPVRHSPLISSRIVPFGFLKQTTLILASDEFAPFRRSVPEPQWRQPDALTSS